ELLVVNFAKSPVEVGTVDVLDAANEKVVASLQGADLASALRLAAGGTGSAIGAAGPAMLFLGVTLPSAPRPPLGVVHRFAISVSPDSATISTEGDRDPTPAPPTAVTFTGAPVEVSQRRAVVLAPPLRGPRWLVGNGCCMPINAHRGATLPI